MFLSEVSPYCRCASTYTYLSQSSRSHTGVQEGPGLHADAENLEKLRPTLDAFPLSHEDKSGP